MTTEKLAEIRARAMSNMPRSVLAQYYRKDVPQLLEMLDDMADQRKELFSRLPRQSHWCPEWDGLLSLPSDPEFEACLCEGCHSGN